jgi:hypothetical protein
MQQRPFHPINVADHRTGHACPFFSRKWLSRTAHEHLAAAVSLQPVLASLVDWLSSPWPWYVAGPAIGLFVPALLWLGNKPFGVSSNLRHLCAGMAPCGLDHFTYDWRREGSWNLLFVAGIALEIIKRRRVRPIASALAGTWLYGYLRLWLPH